MILPLPDTSLLIQTSGQLQLYSILSILKLTYKAINIHLIMD